jgi:hypothetical protein
MTVAENMNARRPKLCEMRSECSANAMRSLVTELGSSKDEVVVFRRDPATGKYDMSSACCEAVLPPIS